MAERRLWVSTYNIPRQFDNGVRWMKLSVRLRRWHRIGGLWLSKHPPFIRILLPQGPRAPITARTGR